MAKQLMNTIGRVAAGAAAVSLVVAATTASAQPRYYHDRHGDRAGTAIAAGIVGLAVGAAIADSGHRDRYYDRGYYAPPPPPPPRYGYGYGYERPYYGRDCWTTRDYDRWSGRSYERTVCR